MRVPVRYASLDEMRRCKLCKEPDTIQNLNCYGNYYLCDGCQKRAEQIRLEKHLTHSEAVRELL